MCSRTKTCASTQSFSDDLDRIREWLDGCDRIVLGAGSGLSAAAGLTYSGPRFTREFGDFISKYGYGDMYTASFQRYGSPEEHWAYWSRHIMINRYLPEDNGTYAALLGLLRGRDCFVITTNVDHCFQRFGFDKSRLFYTQGDYGLWQCSGPCCRRTWDNESVVRRMYEEQHDMRIPSELIPFCPECGRPLTMNLRVDGRFVEDDGWRAASVRYADYLEGAMDGSTLFLELGVGFNTPGIIKYPFWRRVMSNRDARYACVSLGDAMAPADIAGRSVCLNADIGQVLDELNGSGL